MKVFAISDLHLSVNNPKPMNIFGEAWDNYVENILEDWKKKVSEDDLVLLGGDFSWAMKLEDTKPDFNIISSLPGTKVIIRGNHDYWWESISKVRNSIPDKTFALQNDAMKFGNYIVCGTRGWQVPDKPFAEGSHDDKILKREYLRLEMCLEHAFKIKEEGDKVVLLIHYPPFNIKREDSIYTQLIEKYAPDAVVFGHLHVYGGGSLEFVKNRIKYHLTSCDLTKNKLMQIF